MKPNPLCDRCQDPEAPHIAGITLILVSAATGEVDHWKLCDNCAGELKLYELPPSWNHQEGSSAADR